jgi:uncharacterized protein
MKLTSRMALAVCLLAQPVMAGPLEDGNIAYERGDYATALRFLAPLAEKGDAEAQFKLGTMYDNGEGVQQDYAEALKWYRLAADQGNAFAQFALAYLYEWGRGVPQDNVEAVKWYRLAADQGNVLAQSNLGYIYESGLGVPQDLVQAHMWFSLVKSFLTFSSEGFESVDRVAEQMTPDQIAEAQRLAREWIAAHPKR